MGLGQVRVVLDPGPGQHQGDELQEGGLAAAGIADDDQLLIVAEGGVDVNAPAFLQRLFAFSRFLILAGEDAQPHIDLVQLEGDGPLAVDAGDVQVLKVTDQPAIVPVGDDGGPEAGFFGARLFGLLPPGQAFAQRDVKEGGGRPAPAGVGSPGDVLCLPRPGVHPRPVAPDLDQVVQARDALLALARTSAQRAGGDHG